MVSKLHIHTLSEHTSLIFTSLKLKVFPGLYPHCGSFLGQVIIVCKRILGAKVKRGNEMARLTRSSDILLLRKKLSITQLKKMQNADRVGKRNSCYIFLHASYSFSFCYKNMYRPNHNVCIRFNCLFPCVSHLKCMFDAFISHTKHYIGDLM